MNKKLPITTKQAPLPSAKAVENNHRNTLGELIDKYKKLAKPMAGKMHKIFKHYSNVDMSMHEELIKRCIFGLAMAICATLAIMIGGLLFDALVLTLSVVIAFEWSDMMSNDKQLSKKTQYLLGLAYICIPSLSIIAIRHMPGGKVITLWYMMTIWSSDISAYFVGRKIQGKKLCPSISPNKTYSGLFGGICGGVAVSMFLYYSMNMTKNIYWMRFLCLSIFITVLSQASDLLESAIKRRCNVKDSSSIIPGHGGVMDRTDSLVLTVPFVLLMVYLFQSKLTIA